MPFLFFAGSSRPWSFMLSLSLSSFMSLESLELLICWYRALLFWGFLLLYFCLLRVDCAGSKSLIPLSFLADAPAACDAASEPVQVASLVLFRRRCME